MCALCCDGAGFLDLVIHVSYTNRIEGKDCWAIPLHKECASKAFCYLCGPDVLFLLASHSMVAQHALPS